MNTNYPDGVFVNGTTFIGSNLGINIYCNDYENNKNDWNIGSTAHIAQHIGNLTGVGNGLNLFGPGTSLDPDFPDQTALFHNRWHQNDVGGSLVADLHIKKLSSLTTNPFYIIHDGNPETIPTLFNANFSTTHLKTGNPVLQETSDCYDPCATIEYNLSLTQALTSCPGIYQLQFKPNQWCEPWTINISIVDINGVVLLGYQPIITSSDIIDGEWLERFDIELKVDPAYNGLVPTGVANYYYSRLYLPFNNYDLIGSLCLQLMSCGCLAEVCFPINNCLRTAIPALSEEYEYMTSTNKEGEIDINKSISASIQHFKETENEEALAYFMNFVTEANIKLPEAGDKLIKKNVPLAQELILETDYSEDGLEDMPLLMSKWRRYVANSGNQTSHRDYILNKAQYGNELEKSWAQSISKSEFGEDYIYGYPEEADLGKQEAIEQLIEQDKYSIYPNPAKDILEIEGDFYNIASINLTNTQGRIVMSYGSTDNIDISELLSGIYFLEIILKQGSHEIIKVVVQ